MRTCSREPAEPVRRETNWHPASPGFYRLTVLYAVAGFAYLLHSFTMFLSPGFRDPYSVYKFIPAIVGELAFTLWLLLKGVKELPTGSSSMA